MMLQTTVTEPGAMALHLKGQVYSVPSIRSIMSPIPTAICPQYDALRERITFQLDNAVHDPIIRQKVDDLNIPLLIARQVLFQSANKNVILPIY